jgi:hypothetical protein
VSVCVIASFVFFFNLLALRCTVRFFFRLCFLLCLVCTYACIWMCVLGKEASFVPLPFSRCSVLLCASRGGAMAALPSPFLLTCPSHVGCRGGGGRFLIPLRSSKSTP